jgi:predicted GH43/DUF377 family glycosyl hydrolase
MPNKIKHDIIKRWEGNPVIGIDDVSFHSSNIYSAGCIKIDGKYRFLITFESLNGCTQLYYGESKDGIHIEVDDCPILTPDKSGPLADFEKYGILDPRITPIEGICYIIYLAKSKHGFVLCLAETKDFKSIKKRGIISQPDTKAGALFPKKFNGKYARLERPFSGGSIWISYSPDLLHWGESEVVLSPRPGYWDFHYIGCSTVPLEIDEGWLIFYYGVKKTSAGLLTRLGSAILNKKNPALNIIHRSNEPVLSPREAYERIGDINNFVFSCGAIYEDDSTIKLYYSGSDNCLCLGTTTLKDIIDVCVESNKEY